MSDKRPPDPKRDRGGSATLNNPDDGSAIQQMISLGESLYVVTDNCTYRVQLADQIDPGRTNPNLAATAQQKVFDHGMKSDLMRRTFLHARVMFKEGFQEIDIPLGLSHAFDALSNIVGMREIAVAVKSRAESAIAKVGGLSKTNSLVLPAAGSVREDCKAFIQRADHFSHDLLEIVRLFHPEMKKKGWPDFAEFVKEAYGPEDQMTNLMAKAAPILILLRDARDCLEHHLQGVSIRDFAAEADGKIFLPSIEIDFRKSSHPRVSVVTFMDEITEWLALVFEMVTVNMCGKNMKPFAGMQFAIDEVQGPMAEGWPCRFGYGLYYEGQGFVPCG